MRASVLPKWLTGVILFGALMAHAQESEEIVPSTAAPPQTEAPISIVRSVREAMWGELYYQGVYSRRDKDNYISDLTIRQGIRASKIRGNPVEVYLKARLLYDLNSDFWNNVAEAGVGVRYRPFDRYGLVLFGEAIEGWYTGREAEDEIPEDHYANFVGGLAFWQWWGVQPYEIEGGPHFYIPFTGWRETYVDAIFNHRDDQNLISNASYKEGILLGKFEGMTYDAYLAFGAGSDANGDYWNNYVHAGPGFSIRPFEEHDLKIGCEYRSGYNYRAEDDDDLGGYDDINVTISYSLSW